MSSGLHYKCIICRRVLPAEQGKPVPSGSWMCADQAECVAAWQAQFAEVTA